VDNAGVPIIMRPVASARTIIKDGAARLGQRSVVELAVALGVGFGVLNFVHALVEGLIMTPLETAHSSSLDTFRQPLSFEIGGALFNADVVVSYLITLLIVGVLAALVLRVIGPADDEALRDCPNCLEPIPAAARVCSYCTRDVPSSGNAA
jgi:large conductance mechanosensitive channel